MSDDNKSSNTKWWVIGGVAVAAVAGVYMLYASSDKKKKPKKSKSAAAATSSPAVPVTTKEVTTKDEDKTAEHGELSRDQLVAMFRDMVAGMQEVIFGLAKMEQHMRQQHVSNEEMVAALSAQYRDQMQRIQSRAFDKYNTTEEAAERASDKYHNDEEFVKLLQQMEVLNTALTAGVPPPDPEKLAKLPASLTVEKVIDIMTDIMETMTEAMEESVKEVKAKYAPNPPPRREVDNMYLEKIRLSKDRVLSKFQLDSDMLDIALQKYATDAKLSERIVTLQSKQQARLEALQLTF